MRRLRMANDFPTKMTMAIREDRAAAAETMTKMAKAILQSMTRLLARSFDERLAPRS